jgi:hypothetical protein
MELWDNLVKNALVGTARLTPSLPTGDSGIDGLMGKLSGMEKERALLAAAGAVACSRRAGYTPQTIDAAHLPKPLEGGDDLPRCCEAATQDLATMLSGNYTEALPQWLGLVAHQGQRVPEEMLPRLLDYAKGVEGVRSAIGPVLGRRGHWLATQNPSWDFAAKRAIIFGVAEMLAEATEEQTREIWETGTRAERTVVLTTVRQRDPAKGRAMLEAVWSQESYEERAAFLKTLEHGLSSDDEPFLENALDDRRKEVRTVSLELVARLPNTQMAERMQDFVVPLFRLEKVKGGQAIDVTLPEAYDKSWQRYGIEQKPPQYAGKGEKAHWLEQLIAITPLSAWEKHFGMTPGEILAANREGSWQAILRTNWTVAAYRQRNAEWAAALLDHWMESVGKRSTDTMPSGLIVWQEVLPKETLEAVALRVLREHPANFSYQHRAFGLLSACGPTWGSELARQVLVTALEGKAKNTNATYMLSQLASYFPDEILYDLGEHKEAWEQAFAQDTYYRNEFGKQMALRQFRREMAPKIKGS